MLPNEASPISLLCGWGMYLLSRACIWFWLWGPDNCKEERRARQAELPSAQTRWTQSLKPLDQLA